MSATAATSRWIQNKVLATQRRPGPVHLLLIALAGGAAIVGAWCWSLQIRYGMQMSGLNRPVGWGVYITNFVFWVGIAHSGTLISAVLYLLRARFRTGADGRLVFRCVKPTSYPVPHDGPVGKMLAATVHPASTAQAGRAEGTGEQSMTQLTMSDGISSPRNSTPAGDGNHFGENFRSEVPGDACAS